MNGIVIPPNPVSGYIDATEGFGHVDTELCPCGCGLDARGLYGLFGAQVGPDLIAQVCGPCLHGNHGGIKC